MSSMTVGSGSPCCQREQRFQSASTDAGSQTLDEAGFVPQVKTWHASMQVRNTFIYLEDDDSTPPHRVRPRSKTFDCRLLSARDEDGAESESNEADDESLEGQAPEGLACSTPTPQALADSRLAICQSFLAPQAHVPVLLPVFWPGGAALRDGGWPPLAPPAGEPTGGGQPATADGAPALPSCPRERLSASLSSTADGFVRIHWTVDARKLRGSDKQLVSSNFDVDLGLGLGSVVFKVMLATFGGTKPFGRTGGAGYVQVKCVSEGDINTKIRVSIGRGDRQRPPRGPFAHSFSDSPVFTLPRQQAEWDFWGAADEQSMTLVVNVDVAPITEA